MQWVKNGKAFLVIITAMITLLLLAGCNNSSKADNQDDSKISEGTQQEPQEKPQEEQQEKPLPIYYPELADSGIDEALAARYYGGCHSGDGYITYEISMIYHRPTTPEEREHPFSFVLNFYELTTREKLQTIVYQPDMCDDAESIKQGLLVKDFNNDEYDDFLIDLGLFGQQCHAACFVYKDGKGYVEVAGFEGLSYPRYVESEGVFPTDEPGVPGRKTYKVVEDKLYQVVDDKLIPVE